MAKTKYISVPESPDGVKAMMDRTNMPLVLVSRHGLGDNVFISPCFEPLSKLFPKLFLASSVNAYITLWHESHIVHPIYCGSINGAWFPDMQSSEGFCRRLEMFAPDIGYPEVQVYNYGAFECNLPPSDHRAYVKGRRNWIELFQDGPDASEDVKYHVAPDTAPQDYINTVLDRWMPERELICIARHGHTDPRKNFGHDAQLSVAVINDIERRFPGKYKWLGLEYAPGNVFIDGRVPNAKSVYGFLPCDSASMYHVLCRAKLVVTVPTGPMLVAATIPSVRLLTLWKRACPFEYLDPQFAPENPVWAMTENRSCEEFGRRTIGWPEESRRALMERWMVFDGPINPQTVAEKVAEMLCGK